MDDMLKVLMDMDAAARERTDEIKTMKENNQSKLAAQKSEIIEKKMKQAQSQADKFAGELAEETEKHVEEIKIKSEKALSDMKKFADESRKIWVDEIVARALSN